MVTHSIAVPLFLMVLSLAVPNASARRGSENEQWERLVMETVDRFSGDRVMAEDMNDETAHIQDIQSYYREILNSDSGWVDGSRAAKKELKIQSADDVEDSTFRQKAIDGRYIVSLAPSSTDSVLHRMVRVLKQATTATSQRLRADHIETFRHVGKGFTATLNKNMVELVRSHPAVANIETDLAVHMKFFDHGELSNNVNEYSDERSSLENDIETSKHRIPWNLDRLDQHTKELDGEYNPEGTGKGVDVFIIDTGTRYSHADLEGRAKYFGVDMVDELTGSSLKGSDCNGHGTHVAGIVGGKLFGVAKEVTIYSVRGLNCEGKGAVSGVVLAMDLIAKFNSNRPKVVSMSLGIETSVTLNSALERLVRDHEIVAVAAAGNQGSNSCKYSPASSGVAISVGATDDGDEIVSFSNTGNCVHIFAPGRNIVSIGSSCDTCLRAMSGTSMACPHVTGYAAILLGLQPTLKPTEVLLNAINKSTKDAIGDKYVLKSTVGKTPNRLLYVPRLGAEDSDSVTE